MENLWNELDESQDVNYKDNILSVPSQIILNLMSKYPFKLSADTA